MCDTGSPFCPRLNGTGRPGKSRITHRQVSDLTAHAERQGYQIVHIIHETGSATKRSNVDRPELDSLLDLCRKKIIRKVLVTDFSRLGRRRSETPALMEAITQAGVSIYAHNLGLETLLANGKRNPVAGIVIAVMIEPGGRSHRRNGNRAFIRKEYVRFR